MINPSSQLSSSLPSIDTLKDSFVIDADLDSLTSLSTESEIAQRTIPTFLNDQNNANPNVNLSLRVSQFNESVGNDVALGVFKGVFVEEDDEIFSSDEGSEDSDFDSSSLKTGSESSSSSNVEETISEFEEQDIGFPAKSQDYSDIDSLEPQKPPTFPSSSSSSSLDLNPDQDSPSAIPSGSSLISPSLMVNPPKASNVTSVVLADLQKDFDASDDTKIPPQKRLIEMINKLSTDLDGDIDPLSFEIKFALDGDPKYKVEPYLVGTQTFYKIKFNATIQFKDSNNLNTTADGKPLEINFSREIYSSISDPKELVDHAKVFGQGVVDIALAHVLPSSKSQLFKFETDDQKKSALEQNSFRINSEHDSLGRLKKIKSMTLVDSSSKKNTELNINADYMPRTQNILRNRFGEAELKNEDSQEGHDYLPESNYQIHHSDSLTFVKSPELATHLDSIKERLNKSKDKFNSVKSDYEGNGERWKLWNRGKANELNKFEKLAVDLAVDEKVVSESKELVLPKGVSADIKDYLTEKKKYLKLEKWSAEVMAMSEKITSGIALDEKDKNAIAVIRKAYPKRSKAHPDDGGLIETTLSAIKEKLTLHKNNLTDGARKINEQNQKILDRFYQIKEVTTELKAYQEELETLRGALLESKPSNPSDKNSLNKIDATLKEIKAQIKKHNGLISNVETSLKSA